jgi:hypothetical protein
MMIQLNRHFIVDAPFTRQDSECYPDTRLATIPTLQSQTSIFTQFLFFDDRLRYPQVNLLTHMNKLTYCDCSYK